MFSIREAGKQGIAFAEKRSIILGLVLLVMIFITRIAFNLFEFDLGAWSIRLILPSELGLVDTHSWGPIAANVVSGNGFVNDKILFYFDVEAAQPTAARSPLPILANAFLFSLFGTGSWSVYFYQAALLTLTGAALIFSGKHLFGDPLVGLAAGVLYLLFLPLLRYGLTMGSEPLSMLLTCFAAFSVIHCAKAPKIANFAILGLILGVLTLTRPTYFILPWVVATVFLAFSMIDRRRLLVLATLVASLLTVSPWVVRNHSVFGEFVLSTGAGYNLYRHNSALLSDSFSREGYTRHVVALERFAASLDSQGVEYEDLNELALDNLFRSEAIKVILDNKISFVKLALMKSVWLFSLVRTEFRPDILLLSVVLLTAAALGLWRYRRTDNAVAPCTILLIFGSWVGIHAILVSQYRYFVPFVPVLLLFASYAALGYVRKLLDAPCKLSTSMHTNMP